MKQIIKQNSFKIGSEISDYQQSVNKANRLFEAFADAGYQINDAQGKELISKNFSKESLQELAGTLTTAIAPKEKDKELRIISADLYDIILKQYNGWELSYNSFHNVEIKNLKAVENPKVIKEIEDRNTIFAEGQCKEVFDRLQHIAAEFNLLMPQLKKSVFNGRLQPSHLFIENANAEVIPNIDIIDFSDL